MVGMTFIGLPELQTNSPQGRRAHNADSTTDSDQREPLQRDKEFSFPQTADGWFFPKDPVSALDPGVKILLLSLVKICGCLGV